MFVVQERTDDFKVADFPFHIHFGTNPADTGAVGEDVLEHSPMRRIELHLTRRVAVVENDDGDVVRRDID